MLSLILLAAGASKRFGRPKQLEPVGPHGETIMDITIRNAFASGCDRMVLVIRPEHEALFMEKSGADERVRLAVQAEALGTGHAVMIGLEQAEGSTVIANADDFYGAAAITEAFAHASTQDEEHALVAFTLANTLSAAGPVHRALCTIDANGFLTSTDECTGLHADADNRITDANGRSYDPAALVSMNLWVLRPSIASYFRAAVKHFNEQGQRGECMLPAVVQQAMDNGHRVRVLRTDARWAGLTYAADADLVRRTLAEGNT